VLHRQPGAELEQRLAVALDELVEDRPPRRVGECLEHVTHRRHDRQVPTLACQKAALRTRLGKEAGDEVAVHLTERIES
jgi:hypothetical protein